MSLILLAALGGRANLAAAAEARLPVAGYAAAGGRTSMPCGWRDFCGRRPEACDVETLAAVDVHAKPAVWDELDRTNRAVDRTIVSITG